MGKKSKRGRNRQKAQRKPAVPPAPSPRNTWKWLVPLSPTGWFWASVSLILALVGSYYLLRPQISVEPDAAIDPKQPVKTPFRITNSGQTSVYNLRRKCLIRSLESEESHASVRGVNSTDWKLPIPKLRSGESTSLFIPWYMTPVTPYTKGEIEVVVDYMAAIIPIHQEVRFRFETRRNANNEIMWYHKAISE